MKRTTHRSTAGKKLYAKRDARGRITDVQRYSRASAADQRRTTIEEAKERVVRAAKRYVRLCTDSYGPDGFGDFDRPIAAAVAKLDIAKRAARGQR